MRKTPIRQGPNKFISILGADRELTLLLALFCTPPALFGLTWYAAGISLLVFILGLMALQRIFKSDPQMRQIYMRHIKYRSYYPALAHPAFDEKD